MLIQEFMGDSGFVIISRYVGYLIVISSLLGMFVELEDVIRYRTKLIPIAFRVSYGVVLCPRGSCLTMRTRGKA